MTVQVRSKESDQVILVKCLISLTLRLFMYYSLVDTTGVPVLISLCGPSDH